MHCVTKEILKFQEQHPLLQVLRDAGCVYQERQGWERPGWFSPDGPAPVESYDYYGAYDNEAHTDHAYADRLRQDYTFDFPKHHEQVGVTIMTYK